MVCSGEGNVVLEEVSEFSGKGRGELQSSVRDHLGVEAESRENIGEKELGHPFGVNVFCAGAVNYPLRKAMVYHDHDHIISVGIGESSDEIHRYGGKWKGAFDGQRGKSGYHGVCVHLGCLAVSTSRDEPAEEGRHSGPPVVPLHSVEGAKESFVPSGGGFMEQPY